MNKNPEYLQSVGQLQNVRCTSDDTIRREKKKDEIFETITTEKFLKLT